MAEAKKENIFLRILKFLLPWKGDSAREVIRKIVFLISVAALIVCGVYFADRFSQRKVFSDAKKLSSLVEDSDSVNEQGEMEKYTDLRTINPDFVGWLKIPDTGIDVPIVQTVDNDAYLRKDFYGEYSVYGNPFLDYRCNLKALAEGGKIKRDTADMNTTIYGHNMLDNMVFAELLEYKEPAFYKEHPIVEFDTIYGETKWKIIAAFLVNSTADMDNGYTFEYNFTNCSPGSFSLYLEELRKRSYIHTGVETENGDVLLTLSTCDKKVIDEGRFVVVARLLRDGESEEIDTSAVSANANVKFPQGYYDKLEMQNPYGDEEHWEAN